MSKHERSDLPSDILDILDSERGNLAVPLSAKHRVLERLELSIGLPPGGGDGSGDGGASASGATAAGTGLAGAGAGLASKSTMLAAMTFILGTGVGAGIHAQYVNSRRPEPPTAVASVQHFVQVVSPVPSSEQPIPESSVGPRETSAGEAKTVAPLSSVRTESTAPTKDTSLAAERALLETARTAVARGQGASALSALQRHAEQFPKGRLGEEREVLSIQALMSLGRVAEARQRAAQFKRNFSHSMALPAIEAAVGSIP